MLTISPRGSIGLATAGKFIDPLCDLTTRRVVVDLSAVTFAEPFAIVRLAAQLEFIKRSGVEVRVVCPSNAACRRYLASSNFLQIISMFTEVHGDQQLRGVQASWESRTVLPLTRLADTSDLASVITRIENRLNSVLGKTEGETRRMIGAFRGTVLEMCGNVFQHAEYPYAWIAAQRYRPRDPYLDLVIADAGRGVRSSLATSHPDLVGADDTEALRRALAGLSRFDDPDRGGGFLNMQRAADDLNAHVNVRSGRGGIVRARGGALTLQSHSSEWPGTTLRVRIPCSRGS